MEYEFTLKYQLNEDEDADALLERLAQAGCEDALVGVGQPGRLALAFVRESPSAREAIESALKDVREAVPEARLIEATPDLVGLTDVAEIVGVSRQNMRKLMLSHAHSFPAPIHEGSASLWHLAEILVWLQARGSYAIGQETLELARVAMTVNVSSAYQRVFGDSPKLAY
ncbi:DNA-binding protein [Pseudomonas sp. P1B16]|jgi:predicted DNA-binding transcriptional regulator AlpA|uniref:DNA-binding protein n=1 Tax=Pseudomonas capeferrum TaxID=1495066 RepID=A0ABY7R6N5_9PSED|nr:MULTISPECIES: DNA-binding protein [Pseudomonas]KGI91573.1 DNA-binding protein [Pseudomonas sp. H2]MDD2063775.1 DNA-binding protein [Pseudomonas sp. 25571]MUT50492.1 DNA-binding protein [Pseudomonas sp. TDA1]UDU80341.1 DNA-binding protein [Pseudomonas sp. HN2-3]UPL07035.1 putative transcriptional regulator [Pseudomonas sp. IsoF]